MRKRSQLFFQLKIPGKKTEVRAIGKRLTPQGKERKKKWFVDDLCGRRRCSKKKKGL